MTVPLLEVRKLSLQFRTFDGVYQALDRVDLDVAAGDTVGIVGETGCGKSVLAKSVLGLLPSPPAHYPGGEIRWRGANILGAPESRLREVRGLQVAMVFQDPMTFLDPLYTVGDQVREVVRQHDRVRHARRGKAEIRRGVIELFARLGLRDAGRVYDMYPHQLSGGMRQRVLIAMALSGQPQLLIADEPTTALDVTVQGQILRLLQTLVEEMSLAIVLISHDLGVVTSICRRVVVMYAGTVVETAAASDLLTAPLHPYTRGLLSAVPRLADTAGTLRGIPGQIPNLLAPPAGCRFAPRCPTATSLCQRERPELRIIGGSAVACHHAGAA